MKITSILLVLGIVCSRISANEIELKGIDFQQRDNISFLEFLFDKNDVEATSFHVKNDKQIILDFKNVQATPRVLRAFDTSEFSGPVIFVSAYPRPQNVKDIRVVLQLRENVNSRLSTKDNKTTLMIENRFGVFAEMDEDKLEALADTKNEASSLKINIPKSNSTEDLLDNLTLSGPKKYAGRKISLNVKEISLENVLKMISEISGFNVILTPEARTTPPITLTFNNVPWDQVLDTILELNNLTPERKGSILIIHNAQVLAQKRQQQEKEKEELKKKTPLETRVIPISYAKIADLNKILTPYLTKERGKVTADERTNSLIVEDTLEVIERIKKIIEILDTQTPQILIASKIIDVDKSYVKELGLQQGFNFTSDMTPGRATPATSGPIFSFSSIANLTNSVGSALDFTLSFGKISNLNFKLQLYESERKIKTIASPKIITQNNKAAVISASDQEPYPVIIREEGSSQTTYQNVSATTNMQVTPQVTNEGAIIMTINVSRSTFGQRANENVPPPTATRSVNTNVLIDNGSTVVIGGLYSSREENEESGIPLLKDIPLIGWLFRNPYRVEENKTEMMIFLTPTIINQEESGLTETELPENLPS